MIRKPLTCPTCGDTWKKVVQESAIRLGPPVRECRACWTEFATGEREWRDMDRASRFSFLFLQNIVLIIPIFLIMVVACALLYWWGGIEDRDLGMLFLEGCGILLAIYLLMLLRALLQIGISKRRVQRHNAA